MCRKAVSIICFKNGTIKLYINNLFDADYENLSGYPATDRTYGIVLNFDL